MKGNFCMAECGAKTRAGTPCKRAAMPNGRCDRHGGKSLSGAAHPGFTHGPYSKFLPVHLATRLAEFDADEKRLELNQEIDLTTARITELLDRLSNGSNDSEIWAGILEAVELRRKLVGTEQRHLQDAQQV